MRRNGSGREPPNDRGKMTNEKAQNRGFDLHASAVRFRGLRLCARGALACDSWQGRVRLLNGGELYRGGEPLDEEQIPRRSHEHITGKEEVEYRRKMHGEVA